MGVCDNGAIDGVDTYQGRTPTREWLEQLIPELLSYPLQNYRVHEVVRSDPTTIPAEKTLIVIDVGDSPHAPHQSRLSSTYYYRVGSHSKPAPHFYLDALNKRSTQPELTATLLSVEPAVFLPSSEAAYIQFWLRFRVENLGKIAVSQWLVAMTPQSQEFACNCDFRDFPREAISLNVPLLRRDRTLLPGMKKFQVALIGLKVSRMVTSPPNLSKALNEIVSEDLTFQLQVLSELAPSTPRNSHVGQMIRSSLTDLSWYIPDRWPENGKQKIGRDLLVEATLMLQPHSGTTQFEAKFSNHSDRDYREAEFWLIVFNSLGHVSYVKQFSLEFLPPYASKTIGERISNSDLVDMSKWRVQFIRGKGRLLTGDKFGIDLQELVPE